MEEEDYLALIELVTSELQDSGAGDLANERHYIDESSLDGEPRLYPPRKRLVEMLEAFDRFMLARDRALYESALFRMNAVLEGDGPTGAIVSQPDAAAPRDPINLGAAPDLSDPRAELRELIALLRDGGIAPLTRI